MKNRKHVKSIEAMFEEDYNSCGKCFDELSSQDKKKVITILKTEFLRYTLL